MNTPRSKLDDAQDLSPEARTLVARARLFFLFTFGALMLGFIVVAGVIVYRTTQASPPAIESEYVITALKLPPGASIVSAVAADGLLTVTFRVDAMTVVRILDARTGELVREVPVLSE